MSAILHSTEGEAEEGASTLIAQLLGRAAYLRGKGSVKTVGLLEQAAKALSIPSGWLSIETAPKDHCVLVAATPDWVFEARQDLNYVDGEPVWQWVYPGGEPLHANFVPIAWMPKPAYPLPPAPNQGEAS
jgi:hypothetical protein